MSDRPADHLNLRDVFEAIQDGISVLDHELKILRTNAWMEKMYSKGEPLAGRKCYQAYQARQTPCPWCPSLKTLSSGKPHSTVVPYPSEKNPTGWIDLSSFPLKAESGRVIGVIEYVKDISVQKKAEAALRQSEAKLRSLINSISENLALIDSDGIILTANAVLANGLRLPAEELAGRRLFDLLPIPLAESCAKAARDVLMTGKSMQTEDEYRGRIYRTQFYPVSDETGKIRQVVVSGADITDMRKLESLLLQAQKMEAIGTLAGGIAHDFNNLLMGIQGRISVMLMERSVPPSFTEHLNAIGHYVQSAAKLTKQVLGFAREGRYEAKVMDLNELVSRSSTMFGRTRKEIQIHFTPQEDLWPVEADPGQIEQVLLNLYVNAWQAMPAGGNVYLETKNLTLHPPSVIPYGLKPGRFVRVRVTDTGTGIPRRLIEKIFDPFFTTKPVGTGTGLGLSTAYNIMKNHGGFIEVESEEGQGSTFSLFLPATEKRPEPCVERRQDIPRGTETILLVDDEEMVLSVTREILEKVGYRVLTARSGREALELYEQNRGRIDLVILDIVMPDMSGESTFQALKTLYPGVKVLLSSGYSAEGVASRMLAEGCRAFVQKPFLVHELTKKIREALA
jgi:PAS domain S-box-containing protein